MTCCPEISIIVLGHNSRRHLDVCLTSLLGQVCDQRYEILYVDNASQDSSAKYVLEHYPGVSVIENETNLGYAGGNNRGTLSASGDIFVFVNPDTAAQEHWLTELIHPLLTDAGIGLTTSKITLMGDPTRINTCGNDLSLSGITTCRRADEPTASVTIDEDVSAVSGAAFAIRRSLFQQLDGFDERFWMYLEDTDLSWRARLLGFRCVCAAGSEIAHDYDFKLSPAKTQLIERNRYLLLSKNLSPSSQVVFLPQLLMGEALIWGWAMFSGPKHLWAKILALLWLCSSIPVLYRANRETQRVRTIPDYVLLRQHSPVPAITGVASGAVGQAIFATIAPLALMMATVSLYLTAVLQADILIPDLSLEELSLGEEAQED